MHRATLLGITPLILQLSRCDGDNILQIDGIADIHHELTVGLAFALDKAPLSTLFTSLVGLLDAAREDRDALRELDRHHLM